MLHWAAIDVQWKTNGQLGWLLCRFSLIMILGRQYAPTTGIYDNSDKGPFLQDFEYIEIIVIKVNIIKLAKHMQVPVHLFSFHTEEQSMCVIPADQ